MSPADPELNVRGCTVEEARSLLQRFLAEAAREGHHRAKIIHGKGIGSPGGISVVREAVHRDLEEALRAGAITDYRLGNLGEGSAGVTVIWL